MRLLNLLDAKAQSPIPACLRVDADIKPVQLYSMSPLPHTKKQLLLRWMGMKAICLPTDCPVCGERGSQAHWTDCFQLSEVAVHESVRRNRKGCESLPLPQTPDYRDPPLVGK
jgi:hypothetical protein